MENMEEMDGEYVSHIHLEKLKKRTKKCSSVHLVYFISPSYVIINLYLVVLWTTSILCENVFYVRWGKCLCDFLSKELCNVME